MTWNFERTVNLLHKNSKLQPSKGNFSLDHYNNGKSVVQLLMPLKKVTLSVDPITIISHEFLYHPNYQHEYQYLS